MDDIIFLHKSKITIGWLDMGDLSALDNSSEAFKAAYAKAYPEAKPGPIPTSAGMLYRFVHEVQIGDYVVFPSKLDRMINIGVVESGYKYDSSEDAENKRVKGVDSNDCIQRIPSNFFSKRMFDTILILRDAPMKIYEQMLKRDGIHKLSIELICAIQQAEKEYAEELCTDGVEVYYCAPEDDETYIKLFE